MDRVWYKPGPNDWRKVYPHKGVGTTYYRGPGVWVWIMYLSAADGNLLWDKGNCSSLLEAQKILDEQFSLIEELKE